MAVSRVCGWSLDMWLGTWAGGMGIGRGVHEPRAERLGQAPSVRQNSKEDKSSTFEPGLLSHCEYVFVKIGWYNVFHLLA